MKRTPLNTLRSRLESVRLECERTRDRLIKAGRGNSTMRDLRYAVEHRTPGWELAMANLEAETAETVLSEIIRHREQKAAIDVEQEELMLRRGNMAGHECWLCRPPAGSRF